MSSSPRVAIIGTGYVGLTTGACLAHLGWETVCCDIDADKIDSLKAGQIPIVEPGLDQLVKEGIEGGRLTFEHGSEPTVRTADFVFLCVPTPQQEDGSADLGYVTAAAHEIGPLLPPGTIVVNKSTVPVGSFHVVTDALDRADLSVVSNPEFLREGSAIHDFLNPDRVVIGSDDERSAERTAELYAPLNAEIIFTDPASAELIKYAANGFLAMKISFVNSVAAICEEVGADILSVVEGIGSDSRIGRSFLHPGPGWGGSCFPKDSRALVSIAADRGYDFSLMRGVIDTNEHQIDRIVDKVRDAIGGSPDPATVGVLGLTFKAGTDDLRESPSLRIVSRLREHGIAIRGYDPTVSVPLTNTQQRELEGIEIAQSPIDAAEGADAVVILTEWPEFRDLDLAAVAEALRGSALVDGRNIVDPWSAKQAGLAYEGVGRR